MTISYRIQRKLLINKNMSDLELKYSSKTCTAHCGNISDIMDLIPEEVN